MLMKVHNKGQVVIPAHVRKQLGIDVGDFLEVEALPEEGRLEFRRAEGGKAPSLAGSLKEYARDKSFPDDRRMEEVLRRGMMRDG